MAATDATPDFSQIDHEIASLKLQIAHYRRHRSLLANTLLSRCSPERVASHPKQQELATKVRKQHRQNIENAYRIGAGITSFRVKDPDPNAVDEGRVLGIKIEVFDTRARTFDKPYYVFLNRPDGREEGMKVHKHTIPPHIGLRNIVHRYLPYSDRDDGNTQRQQDIVRFARALRQELVAAMKRRNAVLELHEIGAQVAGLSKITAKDSSAREVEVTWKDGAFGRVKVARDGQIDGVRVISSSNGRGRRMREREKAIQGGNGTLDGMVERLADQARTEELFEADTSMEH